MSLLVVMSLLNGLTLAALLFITASGLTLSFSLMRVVNLTHGALYMAGVSGVVGGTFMMLVVGEDWRILTLTLIVIIIGGMGSLGGTIVGALITGPSMKLSILLSANNNP